MAIVSAVPTSRIPDVYYLPITTPRRVGPVQADIVGAVGITNRGMPNVPTFVGSPTEFKQTFGGITPDPNNVLVPLDGYPTFLGIALQQVQDKLFIRVGGSQMSTAYITISNTNGAMIVLWAATPGTWGNSLAATTTAGIDTAHFNLTITNSATGETETLSNLAFADLNALVNTINTTARLVFATQPVLDAPRQADITTFAQSATAGTLAAGQYYGIFTYVNAQGETMGSVEQGPITLDGTHALGMQVATRAGAASVKAYVTAANGPKGTETFAATLTPGTLLTVTSPWTPATTTPPFGPRNLSLQTTTAQTGLGNNALAPTIITNVSFGTVQASGQGLGNDGAGAPSSAYVGVQGSPSTGQYAFAGVSPKPNFVVLGGTASSDTTQWATLAQAGMDNGWIVVASTPQGNTDVQAKAAVNALASLIGSPQADFLKVAAPWIQYQENEYYHQTILLNPASVFAGITAATAPNTAAYNKPCSGMIGPEYPWTRSQIDGLIASNINVFSTIIPSQGVGFVTDFMVNGQDGYIDRMRLLLAQGLQQTAAQFVGEPNGPDLWDAALLVTTAFLDNLAAEGLIPANPAGLTSTSTSTASTGTAAGLKGASGTPAGNQPSAGAFSQQNFNYVVTCDESNNMVNGVITRILYVDVQIRLFPNASMVLFRAEASPDVIIASSSIAA